MTVAPNSVRNSRTSRYVSERSSTASKASAVRNFSKESSVTQIERYSRLNPTRLSISVNSTIDNAGNSPLHLAVFQNDHASVCSLLLKGADPNAKNNGGISPLTISIRMEFVEICKDLLKYGSLIQERRDFSDLQYLLKDNGEMELMETLKLRSDNEKFEDRMEDIIREELRNYVFYI